MDDKLKDSVTKLIEAARAYGADTSIDTCNSEMEAEDALRTELAAANAEIARLSDKVADLEQYIKKVIGDISDTMDSLSFARDSLRIALKGEDSHGS